MKGLEFKVQDLLKEKETLQFHIQELKDLIDQRDEEMRELNSKISEQIHNQGSSSHENAFEVSF